VAPVKRSHRRRAALAAGAWLVGSTWACLGDRAAGEPVRDPPAGATDATGVAAAASVDSVRVLPPIVVRSTRPRRQDELDRSPGGAAVVELGPLRDHLTTTAEVLEHVPGLRVHDYGSLGGFSTVSIRGSGTNQVGVYLDGMPLARAGLGVVDLADLPFAAVERIEVYRGFAPPELAGANLGGAINLVSRTAVPGGPARHRQSFVAGAGSFGTRRFGLSQDVASGGWAGLLVADRLESDGDFRFDDDNGTPLQPGDDDVVARRNNWMRHDEVLLRLARVLPGGGAVQIANQWVRRAHGVPGLSSFQSARARGGATWNVTSAGVRAPRAWGERLELQARADHEWRRDTFADPASEIGLGYQDNRDVTRAWGAHAGARAALPSGHALAADLDVRRERFEPWRRFPSPGFGPVQRRTTLAAGADARLVLGGRLTLHGGLRSVREHDAFAGDLRTPYSQRPARAGRRAFTEPRAGARLRLLPGVHARATWGRHHRTPGFLELFGDGGSVAGSSDLVAEDGTNRDWGVQVAATRAGIDARFEATWFHNHADHLITFLPQSQRTFVARNIGAVRLRGDEWAWRLADARPARRWSLDGHCTRLDAVDLGADLTWYAGKTLPGRPALQVFQRLALRAGGLEVGWEFEHLGRNYLDRWNREVVRRRDVHGIDARWRWRGAGMQLGLRNLTDERAADVAGFPLPGRAVFLTTSYAR
jgi:iron complex outermembrane receptor protein